MSQFPQGPPLGSPDPTSGPYGHYPPQNPGFGLAQTSMVLGILSLFVAGVILGPFAIIKANEAERGYGVQATVGKVTGLIGLIFGALQLLAIVGYFLLMLFIIPATIYGSQL